MWNGLQPWHLIILLVLGILGFGSRRLPDAARPPGKSMRIFKWEIRELQHEGKPEDPPPTKPNLVQSERVDTPAPDEKPTDAPPAWGAPRRHPPQRTAATLKPACEDFRFPARAGPTRSS